MFGGLVASENEKEVKAGATNELYIISMTDKDIQFFKQEAKGDLPLKRFYHTACALGVDRMFVFGGCYDNTIRLNDVAILQLSGSEYIWKRPPNQPVVPVPPKNEPSLIGGPEPRADCSSCLLGNKGA